MVRAVDELVEALCRLPSIGKKSAWRLAMYLLERPEQESVILADAIKKMRTSVKLCSRCFNYSDAPICSLCESTSRDSGIICVVEKPVDVFAIEKSGRFRGIYHVLGGVLSPLNGITVDKIRVAELSHRLQKEVPREIIIGLGGSADAETTALYLARIYKDTGVRITRFARGLPACTDLEYVDQVTLSQALHERTDIKYGEG